MSTRKVILKPGKDKPIRNHHHWIFSGAVAKLPEFNGGECLPQFSARAMNFWGLDILTNKLKSLAACSLLRMSRLKRLSTGI